MPDGTLDIVAYILEMIELFKDFFHRELPFLLNKTQQVIMTTREKKDGSMQQKVVFLVSLDWVKFKKVIKKYFPGRKIPLFRLELVSPNNKDLGRFIRSNRIFIFVAPHIYYAYDPLDMSKVKKMLLETILHELGHWKCMSNLLTFIAPFISKFYYYGFVILLLSFLFMFPTNLNPTLILILMAFVLTNAILMTWFKKIPFPEAKAIEFEKNLDTPLGCEISECLSVEEKEIMPD